jgi:hypothetical protein
VKSRIQAAQIAAVFTALRSGPRTVVDAGEPRFDAVYISNIIHSLDPSQG